jgi:16S rRNA (cytosine967-C5)-methyltransferase
MTEKTEGMVSVQIASADVVGTVLSGRNLDRTLDARLLASPDLTGGERAAVHSISFDCLRHYGLLAAQLDTLLTQPITDTRVRHLLLIALCQLQFSKAASHAIVDHAVTAVETMGFARAKSLVNAVLRNFLRSPDKFKRERFKVLTAQYDFPIWWINRMKSEYPEHWQDALLAARDHPPMWLRVNQSRTSASAYLAKLAQAGISVEDQCGNAVMLEKPIAVGQLPGFREGLVSVQDIGAQMAAVLLDAKNGMRVLDACAAPGGKASHILELADVHLTALDSDRRRLKRVSENLSRLGQQAKVVCADAAKAGEWREGSVYDRILLDAPCSGSGVVRRHPDIKWIRRETDIASFARQQDGLLASLWQALAIGGRLLYATCSVFRSENGEIIESFLTKTPKAKRLGLEDGFSRWASGGDATATTLDNGQLLPNHVHDGFYYALLEKTP